MKVIINAAGFYGGIWFEDGRKQQDMPDGVAKAFLPPYGDQLALPAKAAEKPTVRTGMKADEKTNGKTGEKKAG